MPAFQAASKFLAPPKVGRLEVFGYLPVDNEELTAENSLWSVDQRTDWWDKYSKANSLDPSVPPALKASTLAGITHEPLLCYLLVLAGYATKDWEKAADNPNRIYAALMKNIYDRGWGDGVQKRLGPGRTMTFADFLLLMETIGHAAWLGGDARVATEDSFISTSKITRAETAWKLFIDDNGSDVTNLAMNFYLKAAEGYHRGFEFTHKSFGEYLAAKSLIAVALSIHDLADRRVELAMMEWVKATSTGQMTLEILTFMRNEIRLQISDDERKTEDIQALKQAFVTIAKEANESGFSIDKAENWRSQEVRHINCEISCWSILNASALAIAEFDSPARALIEMKWKTTFDLKNMIIKLGATSGGSIFQNCLSYIDGRNSFIFGMPFLTGDFRGAILSGCLFDVGRMFSVNFRGADVSESSFYACELIDCDFREADLSQASFVNTAVKTNKFDSANLSDLKIDMATIRRTNLHAFSGRESEIMLRSYSDERNLTYQDRPEEMATFVSQLRQYKD